MAKRTEVVSVVECQGALGWRLVPDEIDYWFNRLGVEGAKKEMRKQLNRALEVAQQLHRPNTIDK